MIFWALLLAQLPEAKTIEVPAEIEVSILAKYDLSRLDLVDGRCAHADLAGVTSLSARGGQVRACAGAMKPCIDRPSIALRCEASMVVRVRSLGRRTYGRGLRASVDGRGHLRLVASVAIEDYVSGVVHSELANAPVEAQRAQAVLARSFAVRALSDPRHDDAPLCDLTHCQAFTSARAPMPPRPGSESIVLVDSAGQIADVFFHSTCGGQTAPPRLVWGDRGSPEVVGIDDVDDKGRAWCRRSPHFRWVHELTDEALLAALAPLLSRAFEAGSLELSPAVPSATRWQIGDRGGTELVNGEALHLELSRALGFSAVKSSQFSVKRAGNILRLSGSGLGHRVGLCQMGAMARAKAGQSSREILLAYFPKLDLAKVVVK